jgi:hypothetical protein
VVCVFDSTLGILCLTTTAISGDIACDLDLHAGEGDLHFVLESAGDEEEEDKYC